MPINYPTSLDTLTNPASGDYEDGVGHAAQHSNANDAIEALEAKLGIGSSTPVSGKVLRANGTGSSIWGALDLTTDVTGQLPVANGGTGQSTLTSGAILEGNGTSGVTLRSTTGSGNVVKATSPTLTTPTVSGDQNMSLSTGNFTVAGADPYRAFYIPASAMFPSTTNGCAPLAQVESSTNKVNVKTLDFDGAGTTKENAEFGIQSPSYWDAGTVLAQFIWLASAGSGTVKWEIAGLARSDDDAIDTAYGTAQSVTDTLLATGDVHVTSETSAITIAGSPVAGDWLQFRVDRDPANDTNTSDARLLGVRLKFKMAQYNDA